MSAPVKLSPQLEAIRLRAEAAGLTTEACNGSTGVKPWVHLGLGKELTIDVFEPFAGEGTPHVILQIQVHGSDQGLAAKVDGFEEKARLAVGLVRELVLEADPTEEEHEEARLAHAEAAAEREGAVLP